MHCFHVATAPLLVLGLALPPGVTTGGATPAVLLTVPDDHASAFLALCDEFEEAQEAHYAAYQEKWGEFDFQNATAEQRAQVQKWWRDGDPSARFVARFEELAVKAKGADTAVQAWGKVLELAPAAQTPEASSAALRALNALNGTLASPAMAAIADQLRYDSGLPREGVLALLGALRDQSPHESVQAAASYALALQYMGADADVEQKNKARALLADVCERFKDARPQQGRKTYAQMAAGQLFELDHLQIGMVAPDMEAFDVDGVKFRLSDFHGKVTVVDFWGHW